MGGSANKRRSASKTTGQCRGEVWKQIPCVHLQQSKLVSMSISGTNDVRVDRVHYEIRGGLRKRRGEMKQGLRGHLWWIQEGQCAPACLPLSALDIQSVHAGHDMKITLGVK